MESTLGVSLDFIKNTALLWGKQFLIAILIFWIGMRVVKILMKGFKRAMQLRELDKSLAGFLESLLKMALQTFVVIATINQLGVATTSIVAVLGAAGLAVGLALSGTLQNFAGGAMILMFKPFKVGDFIEAQGHTGSVNAIQIFVTTLTTPDNKVIIIPNGPLSNGSLINYSAQDVRRVDWLFGIGYDADLDEAKQTIREILEVDERTLKEKPFTIELAAMADSSLNIVARVWVNAPDYWDVHYAVNTAVFNAFKEKGISIPYPQMDVHLHK